MIAVVGGGIAGLSTAFELVEAGYDVAVLEGDRIATGTSGNTTAKLTSQHGLIYDTLCTRLGVEGARRYAEANEAAIDIVERRIDALGIEAGFTRRPNFVYTTDEEKVPALRREVRAANRLDLPAAFVESIDAPVPAAGAVRFGDQAQFHPRAYLLALAEAIEDRGGRIYESTRATDLTTGRPCRVDTTQGTIRANQVVIATLFPFIDRAGFFARMHPSRAYLLAARIEDEIPPGMYLSTASSPATFRGYGDADRRYLIVGGQSHSPGDDRVPASERYRRCERFARRHFEVTAIDYRWSAHDYVPVDRIPFIGPLGRLAPHTYVATGFAKWGMTGGTAAGRIIAEQISAGESGWGDVFDPLRWSGRDFPGLLSENVDVAGRWLASRAEALLESVDDRSALPDPGSGTVLRHRGRPVAVRRDEGGTLHALSAVCPHMHCVVEWNDADRTWDCPCHGSRFDADGDVRYGPATVGLPERDVFR